jgi:hypothetical protein
MDVIDDLIADDHRDLVRGFVYDVDSHQLREIDVEEDN